MPGPRDNKNVVKIAVKMDDQTPQLIELDQERALKLVIQDLCSTWNTPSSPDNYALQFTEREINTYITEKNRNEIKNGSILLLTHSPSRTAQDILDKLRHETTPARKEALERLVVLSCDPTFANEFVNKQGKEYLTSALEQGLLRADEGLGLALESFVELMNHGICSWDSVSKEFIGKIANQVNSASTAPNTAEPKILTNSLAILESIVTQSTQLNHLVEAEVTLPNLIAHVSQNAHHSEIQQNSIALINALFHKSVSKRKAIAATLSSKQFRNVIINSVINSRPMSQTSNGAANGTTAAAANNVVGSEMAHQLYVLQSLAFNLWEEFINQRSLSTPGIEMECRQKVDELRRLAFESDVGVGGSSSDANRSKTLLPGTNSSNGSGVNYQDDFSKLGFTNYKNPIDDFNVSPPGVFALDLIVYFARNHTDNYVKMVLENCCRADREHECPFIRSSIQLAVLIVEILKLCEPPSDEGKLFYPMFFTHDHPLEEFFCISVQLLNKTWKEMRATVEDFAKVFSVLRQQLTRSLQDPDATSSFEKFRHKLNTLSYAEIMNLWQKERINREEWENKAQSIKELREAVRPEIKELIKQQRLLYLTDGTQFIKFNNKGARVKDKFWYCRLSSNFKVFHYGDCEENKVPTVDELCHKLAVTDIRALVTGKDCPHMAKDNRNKKTTFALAFSLIPDSDQDEPLNFVANDEKTFAYWTDGINGLLGHEMESNKAKEDMETLLSMDIKLRLLDTEGVTIPEVPPEIPPPPPNYDYNFKY